MQVFSGGFASDNESHCFRGGVTHFGGASNSGRSDDGGGFQLQSVFDFGKHRGKHIGHADDDYLQWVVNKFSKSDSWWKATASTLTGRQKTKSCQSARTEVRDLLRDLKSCTRKRDLQRGRDIHTNAVETGMDSNVYVAIALINLYAKCSSMQDARTVFNSMQDPDVVSWTALIQGYVENGEGLLALDVFSRMMGEGICAPNSFTYMAALKACTLLAIDGDDSGKSACLERGRKIHSDIGCHMDHFLQNTLINMYAKCGTMQDATSVFDSIQEPNVFSWTALILGYADNGQGQVAFELFSRMKKEGNCTPDSFIYLAALKACTLLAADEGEVGKRRSLERARHIHLEIGCHMNHFLQTTLIKLYAKCGSMEDARTVFDSIHEPNVISWTSLIQGYADNGQGFSALDMFSRMKEKGRCTPDSLTYVAALMACCLVGALSIGRRIHSAITEFDSHVITCLVDFYAKCGSIEEAREVFDLHPQVRDISTWTALLAGYAQFGDTGTVFNLFEAMQDQGFQPNSVTFVCMLSCCSHAGMVAKAREYLELMPTRYGVTPTVMHYNCMIDLLGRANKLDEAISLLQKMPCDPHAMTWMTLLGACRKWKNVKIGRWAFKCLRDLDQKNAHAYVLMAEIYGSRGLWEEQERVLGMLQILKMDS